MDFEKIKNWLRAQEAGKIAIILILLITFVRGVIYATVFPLWQAPDEPAQFEYIDFYAKKHLPFASMQKYKNNDTLILEEVDKEILDSWYDLKSWEYIFWDGPHSWFKEGKKVEDIGGTWMGSVVYSNPPGYPIASLLFYTPVHFTDVRVRAYAVRLFSVILSVLVVYLGYRTAKELFPDDLFIVLGTPLFITFIPMFTHMSGVINPDNLANFGAALFIFYSVKILKKFSWVDFLILSLSAFIGFYGKRTAFFTLIMLFLIPIFILILSKSDKLKPSYKRFALIFIYCAVGLFGGVYLTFAVGNKLGFYTFDTALLVSTKDSIINYFQTQPIEQFVNSIKFFSESFWASFGWGVKINRISYPILWNLTFFPLAGLFFVLIKEIFYKRSLFSKYQLTSIIYLIILFVIAFSIIVIRVVIVSPNPLQGRWLYTAIIPIAIFTTLGLTQMLKNKVYLLSAMFLALFLFDLSSLLIYIIPFFYKTPQTYNLSFLSPLANLFNKPFILNSVYFYIFIFFAYFFLIGYLVYFYISKFLDISWEGMEK
jgi:hypothetical protein